MWMERRTLRDRRIAHDAAALASALGDEDGPTACVGAEGDTSVLICRYSAARARSTLWPIEGPDLARRQAVRIAFIGAVIDRAVADVHRFDIRGLRPDDSESPGVVSRKQSGVTHRPCICRSTARRLCPRGASRPR